MPRWRQSFVVILSRKPPIVSKFGRVGFAWRDLTTLTEDPAVPRFAANLSMMFGEVPFLDRFAAAADAGFEAVEFLFPYDHEAETVAAAAKRAGVSILLFNLPPGDWAAGERGIAAFPGRASEFSASLTRGLDYAITLGTPRLHLMAGIGSRADMRAWGRYKDALVEAAEAARSQDVDILIEPLNRRDMPGYLLDDFNVAADLIQELALPNLRLQFDIYHRQIMHGDVIASLKQLMPVTGHLQIASVPGRHEPCTGELNDVRLFDWIDELGYTGHIGCEYRPLTTTMDGLGWFRDRRIAETGRLNLQEQA